MASTPGAASGATAVVLRTAALRVLARDGLRGATSRGITSEAGANLAAITYHFGSKEALLTAALLGEARRWLDPVLDALCADGEDPIARTAAGIVALQAALEEARPLLPAYFEAISPTTALPGVRAGVLQLLEEVRQFLRVEMERQVGAGELPGWVDPAAMAALQVAVVHGVALQALLGGAPEEQHAMAAQFLQLLVAARPG